VSSSKGERGQKSVHGGLLLSCGHLKQREGCGQVCSEMFDGDVRGCTHVLVVGRTLLFSF
jgi:hypothetical protein